MPFWVFLYTKPLCDKSCSLICWIISAGMISSGSFIYSYLQPCHTPGRRLVEAYERQTMGTGQTFWKKQWRRIHCLECVFGVTSGSFLMQCQMQNVVGWIHQGGATLATPPWRTKIIMSLSQNTCCNSVA